MLPYKDLGDANMVGSFRENTGTDSTPCIYFSGLSESRKSMLSVYSKEKGRNQTSRFGLDVLGISGLLLIEQIFNGDLLFAEPRAEDAAGCKADIAHGVCV